MSIESARAFAMKMKEDEAFRKSVIEAGHRGKAMETARAGGYDFTLDEIRQVRKEEIAKLNEGDELGDEDLAKVAAAGRLDARWGNLCEAAREADWSF